MSNEAFEKFKTGKDWSEMQVYAAKESWQAAIAYMQEQSEPVAWIEIDCIGERYLCFSKPNSSNQIIPLYITPAKTAAKASCAKEIDILKKRETALIAQFHMNMCRAFPTKSHEEISNEINKILDQVK